MADEISERIWRRKAPNLNRRRKKGVWFYSYDDPITKKEKGLGSDFHAANAAAHHLNQSRMKEPVQALVQRVEQNKSTWADHLDWFIEEVLKKWRSKTGKPMGEDSLYIRTLYIEKMKEFFGPSANTGTITRARVSEFLEQQTDKQFNRYRGLMENIFRHAISRGFRDDNPVVAIIEKQTQKDRQRLPREAFDKIRTAAEPWLQRAMDLALWSLQRREDLTLLRLEENWKGGKLYVRQGKVEGHGTGLLAITPGPHLRAAIIACLNAPDRNSCPFLLYRIPKKKKSKRSKHEEWREHPYQIDPDVMSREFSRIRDELKLFEHLTYKQRPTLHEIKGLGGDVYRTELKWSNEQIQALMGHTEVDTTEDFYLSGHGDRWQEVQAG